MQFTKRNVEFLCYVFENGTIELSKGRIRAVENFTMPLDRKSIQRFLGLTSYFRRFMLIMQHKLSHYQIFSGKIKELSSVIQR